MTNSLPIGLDQPRQIPSVQTLPDGSPRFLLPVPSSIADADALADCEANGGVDAELRVFLDEQLDTGDLLLDMHPGFGFLALSAATAPNGVATVLVAEQNDERLTRLQDAAAEAGSWIERLPDGGWDAVPQLLESRLEGEARLIVHVAIDGLDEACARLASLPQRDQLLALCVSLRDGAVVDFDDGNPISRTLAVAGLTACSLVATEHAPVLIPLNAPVSGSFLALPASLFASTAHEDAVPLSADATPPNATPADATPPDATPAASTQAGANRLMDGGFSLLAPHSRTGYGVVGAQLLRAVQQRGVPVAFFPIGPVDASLTENPALSAAVDAQARFPAGAPSVRLAQQFDLALHAGRGAHVAFPIFESDRFSSRELHHLRAQDAVLVCTPWARDVCLANGLPADAVRVVPLGVDTDIFHPQRLPATGTRAVAPGSDSETVFLQVGKLEARKGQVALLRAFEAAFDSGDSVRLILACHNPFLAPEAFNAILRPFRASRLASRITVHRDELASSQHVAALMATAHCGVFPARAEGWNLEALEMLAMGKQVIASNATGHTAYLTADNARLIEMGAVECANDAAPTTRWPAWGAAQHEQLVHELRAVHAARLAGASLDNPAGLVTAQAHGWPQSATALLTALAPLA